MHEWIAACVNCFMAGVMFGTSIVLMLTRRDE